MWQEDEWWEDARPCVYIYIHLKEPFWGGMVIEQVWRKTFHQILNIAGILSYVNKMNLGKNILN